MVQDKWGFSGGVDFLTACRELCEGFLSLYRGLDPAVMAAQRSHDDCSLLWKPLGEHR